MINFDKLRSLPGWVGGNSGYKERKLIDDEVWILKFAKSTAGMKRVELSYTTAPLSEYLGSHIFEMLGIPVQKTMLGICNNELVVACKDFNDYANHINLITYDLIKNEYQEDLRKLIEQTLTDSQDLGHGTNLKEIIYNLELNPTLQNIPDAKDFFWNMVLVDGLIKNNDRNSGNWGIMGNDLEPDFPVVMAPVYDNGAAFSNKLSDRQMLEILNDKTRLMQSSCHVDTGFDYNGKFLEFRELLEIQNDDLKAAILRMTPIISNRLQDIKKFIADIPVEMDGYRIISDIQREFYYRGMEECFSKLIRPRYDFIREEIKKIKDVGFEKNEHGMNM